MSSIKITELPVATSLTGAEVVPVVQGGGTVQVAVSVFVDYLQDPDYFRAVSGTVSQVSYSFKDSANTGVYSPATGQLGLVTNGAERLRIDASGNVGIGTSTPSARLSVNGEISSVVSGAGILQTAIDSINSVNWQVGSDGAAIYFGSQTNHPIRITTNNIERFRIDASGNVRVGTAALATAATDGFLYVPTCPGTPTGTPTAITGLVPIVVNSTNNKLYFYSGGAWRDAGP